MFPDAARLRRLLDYLSIRASGDLVVLDDIQIIDPASGNKITQESLNKIDHIRKAVYNGNNYNQKGLFQFRIGLLFLEYGWYSEAAESFGKATSQWSYLPERPTICLANFAKAVAHHRDRRFDLATQIYSEVEKQVKRIREDVSVPSPIPRIKKYQEFINDLAAQLDEAQKTVTRDIFHDLSPRIHPSLQMDSQFSTSTNLLDVDPEILRTNIERNLSLAELKSLCFAMKIDFNGLFGEGIANKARELIASCIHNQRLTELFHELRRRNSTVSWEDNRVQPDSEEIIDGEVVEENSKPEDVFKTLMEEFDASEAGTEFFRSPLGKVRFNWEDESSQVGDNRMVAVNVDLSGNFDEFSLEEQEQFVQFISRITAIHPNQVTILEVVKGSIKVTVQMPDESARLLINMLLENDPILKNFRILKVELGEGIGQPKVEQPVVKGPRRLWQNVTPQLLRQFIFLYFNDSQLRDLYFEMDVDYDSLPGHGKRDKAREIVAFCNRHKKFGRLVELIQEKRPNAFEKAFSTGS